MNNIAIRVENIGKQYHIGVKREKYKTLRDTLTDIFISPYRKASKLLRGQAYGAAGLDEIIWALKDVSFDIKQGEVVGIIGSNGAGKSTLLKILSQITEPTTGFAEVRGRVGSLLEVGTGFHPELTGRENIYLNGAILGMKRTDINKNFDEIVAFAEVEKFIETPVKHYSSGMYLRLAFSVAAHLEPDILLVDEVLAVGDAQFQKKCLNKMQDVGQEGRTVIFVSHNMPAISRLCERAILINEGRLLMDGPSNEVVNSYLHSGHGTMAERSWTDPLKAPGGEIVRLRSIRVMNEEGQTIDSVDSRQPIGVEMEYEVLKSGYVLLPIFRFINEEGVRAFVSNDLDPTWRKRPRPAGLWKSTVWIPGNFMSEGTLFIGPSFTTLDPIIHQFNEHDVVAFRVYDSMDGDTARGDWPGRIDAAVRPLFKWTNKFTQNGDETTL